MHSPKKAKRDAARLWRLCTANGRLDDQRARFVVNRLIETENAAAAAVLSHFRRRLRVYGARWSAQVQSATPLAASERAAIEEGLLRRYGRSLTTTFAVDAALIGGMCLTVGCDVYDGSVRARLNALEVRF
jgi:F-type H+-transporting ATPase subunit delta